ncbi:MAG: adenylate/guanylate cyclase domain-containing protein, partial [Oxalobacteraceae bacterium]
EVAIQVLNYFDKGGLIGVKEKQPVFVAYPEGGDSIKPTIYGVTAHLAERLQATATPGRVVMSGDCYSLVNTRTRVRFLGRQALRGFQQELELYELVGIRSLSSSQRFRRSKLSSLRGRSQEMAFLRYHLDESVRTTRVIGISGRPGTGKSRLCYEFAQVCRAHRIPVFEMRTHSFGRMAPLQPVLEFIRSAFFRITSSQSPTAARRQIMRRLKGFVAVSSQDLSVLYDFLGIPDDAVQLSISPTARREQLLVIIRSIITYFGHTRSVVILEDVQWLDEVSETFIAALLDAFAASRILLIINYRTSYTPSYVQNAWFEERILRELPQAEIEALVDELASAEPALDDLRTQIAHRSGGNPFFAEEIVKSLIGLAAEKYMAGSKYSARMTLPITVQGAIAAQIDSLDSSDRELLHIVAVLGHEISLPILATITDLPSQRLREELARLCAAELLQEERTQGSSVWKFRHPLIQEVAYGTQLTGRRELMHAKIAQALHLHHIERIGEFAAL